MASSLFSKSSLNCQDLKSFDTRIVVCGTAAIVLYDALICIETHVRSLRSQSYKKQNCQIGFSFLRVILKRLSNACQPVASVTRVVASLAALASGESPF